jgi:hypothetical protein
MRFYLSLFLAALSFSVFAGPTAEVSKDPAVLKTQLQV